MKKHYLLIEIILFILFTAIIGYAVFRTMAGFYLDELRKGLYLDNQPIPMEVCYRAGDRDFGGEEYPIIYITENSIKGVLMPIPIIETGDLGIEKGSLLYFLAKCESSLNPNAHNPDDPNGGSFGLFQFQKTTFKQYCVDKYGLRDDIWSASIQIECAKLMLGEGKLNHWSCAKKI